MAKELRPVALCLLGLALALVVVGTVSGTIVRHIVQIAPLASVGLLARRPAAASSAALPIFAFWMAIAVLIWMFLLGVSRIANGTYSATEIAMTVVMAGCSVVGSVNCVQLGRPLPLVSRAGWFAVFAILQIGAMWVSLLRPIANR